MGDVILVAVLALPLVGFWLVIRGQQRRSAEAARLASSLRVGQDVVTTSGLYGTVAALDESEVTLLVAPTVELRFDRRAVGRILDDESDTPGAE
jgi:preprotein translocase subunit YajC